MTDPNATYKAAFRELEASLGRNPTTTEMLPAHEEYKRSWAPAEESTAAGRPVPAGFSRQPAPQAGAIGEIVRASNTALALMKSGVPERDARRLAPDQPLSATDKSEGCRTAVSEPGGASVNPEAAGGLIVGRRGPAGGILAACVTCGQAFERPARKGRPPVRCEGCR